MEDRSICLVPTNLLRIQRFVLTLGVHKAKTVPSPFQPQSNSSGWFGPRSTEKSNTNSGASKEGQVASCIFSAGGYNIQD